MKPSKNNPANNSHYHFLYLSIGLLLTIILFIGIKQSLVLNHKSQTSSPNSTPTPILVTGSTPGWVKYTHPENRFNFEYPENWFYNGHNLYNITYQDYVAYVRQSTGIPENVFQIPLEISDTTLSHYLEKKYFNDSYFKYQIHSTNHTFFGDTDVVTYILCNSIEAFIKGGIVKPGKYCESRSFIDLKDKGYITVFPDPIILVGKTSTDYVIYKTILSTVKSE